MYVRLLVYTCICACVRACVRACLRACKLASASVKVIEVISEKWTHFIITCTPLRQRIYIAIFSHTAE